MDGLRRFQMKPESPLAAPKCGGVLLLRPLPWPFDPRASCAALLLLSVSAPHFRSSPDTMSMSEAVPCFGSALVTTAQIPCGCLHLGFDRLELLLIDKTFFVHGVGLDESIASFAPLKILLLLLLQMFKCFLLHLMVSGRRLFTCNDISG